MNQTRLQILNIYSSKNHVEAEIIPLKPKLKQISPWETINISQKRASLHEAAKLKYQNPTPECIKNFKLIQRSFVKLYENEKNDYIENKIEEIQNAATNKKSALDWKTVNEIIGRKKTNKAKLKAKKRERTYRSMA